MSTIKMLENQVQQVHRSHHGDKKTEIERLLIYLRNVCERDAKIRALRERQRQLFLPADQPVSSPRSGVRP